MDSKPIDGIVHGNLSLALGMKNNLAEADRYRKIVNEYEILLTQVLSCPIPESLRNRIIKTMEGNNDQSL